MATCEFCRQWTVEGRDELPLNRADPIQALLDHVGHMLADVDMSPEQSITEDGQKG